jgi:hypothetical protein
MICSASAYLECAGILRRAQRWRVVFVLVELPVLALFSFFLSLLLFWALVVLRPSVLVVAVGCYINIAGRRPISRTNIIFLFPQIQALVDKYDIHNYHES